MTLTAEGKVRMRVDERERMSAGESASSMARMSAFGLVKMEQMSGFS
jgi:hypothetical protein